MILIWRKPFQYNKKIVVSTIFFAQRLVHTNKDKMRIIKDVEKEENYEDCFCRKSQQWKDDHVQCTYRQELTCRELGRRYGRKKRKSDQERLL